MKACAPVVVTVLLAAGCAAAAPWHASWHSGWSKPGMTGESFEQDVRACDREAMRASAGQPGHQASATIGARTVNPTDQTVESREHKKAYVECMQGKGYVSTKGK